MIKRGKDIRGPSSNVSCAGRNTQQTMVGRCDSNLKMNCVNFGSQCSGHSLQLERKESVINNATRFCGLRTLKTIGYLPIASWSHIQSSIVVTRGTCALEGSKRPIEIVQSKLERISRSRVDHMCIINALKMVSV